MSYEILNNVIFIPLDMSGIAFTVSEDKKTLTPITMKKDDSAEFVLNNTRKAAYRQISELHKKIKSNRALLAFMELAGTLGEEMGMSPESSKRLSNLDVEGFKKNIKDTEQLIAYFQEFMETSLELMMDFNVTIEQLDSEGSIDTKSVMQDTENLLANLKKPK